jgi:hypothetical protein
MYLMENFINFEKLMSGGFLGKIIKILILSLFFSIFSYNAYASDTVYVSLNCESYVSETIDIVDINSCPPLANVIPESPENLPVGWTTSLIGIFPQIARITQINFIDPIPVLGDTPVDSFFVTFSPVSKKKNKYVWIRTPDDLELEGTFYYRWNNSKWKNIHTTSKTCDERITLPGKDEIYQEVWASREEIGNGGIDSLRLRYCLSIPSKSTNKLELKVQRSASSSIKCSYGRLTGWSCGRDNVKAFREVFLTAYVSKNGTKITNKN